MAVLVETCCCGCSLRTGVNILCIFGLIISAYSINRESQSIKFYKQLEENAVELSQDLPFSKKHFLVITRLAYVNLAFKVISLLVNLLLLGSTCSGEKRLAYPWLGWSMFELFFDFGVIVFFIVVWNGFAVFFIPYGIGWLLSIYFIVVVYSYIEDNRPENNISPSSGFSSSSDRRRPISNGNFVFIVLMLRGLRNQIRYGCFCTAVQKYIMITDQHFI
ncbi:uncharacterized protein LOC111339868 [Stylophora pistillata]|uniref:uncharacterized protein LOC111339868 n=1 Tax=Stylophora pistillata TaxID=50429 RepID=UPI000C04E5A0|nr:uncharacterized protein LOC111339868 [Stylophora pistillata]